MALAQRWTAVVSVGLVMGALLACKKKPDLAAEASATASAPPAPAASVAPVPAATAAPAGSEGTPAPAEAKLGDVKRYGVEKESRLDDAGVRVAADGLKVYDEADTKTDDVATLPKDLLVFRRVKMDAFTLVEFPSGVGQFSQGWVETKGLSTTVEKVSRDAALSENKTATVKVKDGGTAAPADAGKADAGKATDGGKAADAGKAADTKADAGSESVKKAAIEQRAKAAAEKAAAEKAAAEKAKK